MITSPDHAVDRMRRFSRKGAKPKKYRKTFEVSDEHSGQVMAVGELVGQAVFATIIISDQHQHIWQMKPNRRVMPSRWTLTDPQGQVVLQFDQKILGKLANPPRQGGSGHHRRRRQGHLQAET